MGRTLGSRNKVNNNKKQYAAGRTRAQAEILQRFFAGREEIEAKKPFRYFLLEEDAYHAIPGDPCNCAHACALRRTTGSKIAVMFKSIAYVGMPYADGEKVVRYLVPPRTRRSHERYDLDQTICSEGFELVPPAKSQTLEFQRQEHRASYSPEVERARRKAREAIVKRKAIIKGTAKKSYIEITHGSLRPTGSGMVHFINDSLLSGKQPFRNA